jgi:hypothetical protein
MGVLKWNQRKVQNLTAWEIWGFIAGRVLVSFGVDVLAAQYFPQIVSPLGIPAVLVGLVLLAFALKGFTRTPSVKDQ